MNRRKEWKRSAKSSLKKHYWMLVVLCLFAAFLGIEYGVSFTFIHSKVSDENTKMVYETLLTNGEEAAKEEVAQKEASIREKDTNVYLGRSRGVFSMLLNSYSSGSFLIAAADAVKHMVGSGSLYLALMILGGLAVYCFIWIFVKETYLVVMRRIVLESRVYEKVPVQRFLYPLQTGKWGKIAGTMLLKSIYHYLWSLTVVGGLIKGYSYSMVPYILAENPAIGAKEAITLSRKMMKGHKWESFLADVSFCGWSFLNIITLGISGIFYSNPYKAAFRGEYYAYVRASAAKRNVDGTEALCDRYLFEQPEAEVVAEAYPDLEQFVQQHSEETAEVPKGFWGWLSRWFGILLFPSEKVWNYEKQKADAYKVKMSQEILSGEVYPGRLAPVPIVHKVNITSNLMPAKSYTALNLIMMFFIFAIVGWVWEVSLHLITDGNFVNRGVLHGPWLPIYGTGGILILILLKSLREKPALEFTAAVILCGCVEYYTAWNLEMTHNGQRWWDYSGYFLNLHGRICAEGLLVFGLGGLAIVYLAAPFLDNLLNRTNRKWLALLAALLLIAYIGDQMYSKKSPNMGEGITSVSVQPQEDFFTENFFTKTGSCYTM